MLLYIIYLHIQRRRLSKMFHILVLYEKSKQGLHVSERELKRQHKNFIVPPCIASAELVVIIIVVGTCVHAICTREIPSSQSHFFLIITVIRIFYKQKKTYVKKHKLSNSLPMFAWVCSLVICVLVHCVLCFWMLWRFHRTGRMQRDKFSVSFFPLNKTTNTMIMMMMMYLRWRRRQ